MTPETKAKLITDPEWGQTPWENLTKEELILECARMWSVIVLAQPVMAQCQCISGEGVPLALTRAEQVLDDVPESDSICRAFFRYADSLLFPADPEWKICDNCESLWAVRQFPDPGYCHMCKVTKKGEFPLRPLTLADLRPQKGEPI